MSIGFVEVSLVKERLRSMRLSEKIMFHLMEVRTYGRPWLACLLACDRSTLTHYTYSMFYMQSMKDYQDDEMVSLVEFRRLFKAYTAKKA